MSTVWIIFSGLVAFFLSAFVLVLILSKFESDYRLKKDAELLEQLKNEDRSENFEE